MKKITGIFTALSIASSLFFSSCQEVIFDSIREEVKLEEADVSGQVNSIIRFKDASDGIDYIYVQNGEIWRKSSEETTAHNWTKVKKPKISADYVYINKIASDSTYLYAQAAKINEDEDEGENISSGTEIWSTTDGQIWNQIAINGTSTFKTKEAVLFGTNAINNDNRKAFVCYDSKIWELNGTTATEISDYSTDMSYTSKTNSDGSVTSSSSAKTAAYFNGKVYFSSGYAISTNETPAYTDEDGNAVSAKDATMIYYSSKSKIFYSTDGVLTEGKFANSVDLSAGTIYSIALTSDHILVGTTGGLETAPITEGVPSATTDTSTFKNASSTLSSYYEVNCVLVVNPALDELKTIVYGTTIFEGSSSSTSATSTNQGLWAYYPTRGKWNRE